MLMSYSLLEILIIEPKKKMININTDTNEIAFISRRLILKNKSRTKSVILPIKTKIEPRRRVFLIPRT